MERILPLLRVGMKSNTHTWNDFGLKQRVNLELGPSVVSVAVGVSLLPPGLMSLSRQAGHPNSASQQLMDYMQKTRVVLEQVRQASEGDTAALTREWALDQRAEWLVLWVGRSTITTCLKKQELASGIELPTQISPDVEGSQLGAFLDHQGLWTGKLQAL